VFAQIDADDSLPGLWISGPAGFGKSTLIATYLEARALPTAWLQLDAGDADASTFAHFLGATSASRAPRGNFALPVPTADDLRDVPAFIRRCFRALVVALDRPWVLVLDNIQEIDRAPQLHAGLAAALGELPEGTRLIAISRTPPPPEYARVLAAQQMGVIETNALRFTANETQELLGLHGRQWSAETLCTATGGWAAAMILMLAARTELVAVGKAPTAIAHERIFDLIASEVMEAMASSERNALMRIAFLPSATAAMAVAISGEARAGDLLADLARRSLFTDRRDASPPVYTFHALFGAFLRACAVKQLSPDALRALRVEAAGILESTGDASAAIGLLIEAQAWDEAMDLLAAHAGQFVAQGRSAVIGEAILRMPEAWRARPLGCYWLGFCQLAADPRAALEHLRQAHRGFQASGDLQGEFEVAAAAADAIIFLGSNYDALAPWMPILEAQAPAYLERRDTESDLRVLPGLLGAFVHRNPGHPLTAAIADAAESMLDGTMGASQRILLGTLAYYLLWTGQTPRLDRILVKIDRMCGEQDAAPATLLRWHGVSVLVRSLLGRVDEALDHARRALALTLCGPTPMRVKAHLMMVLAAEAARDAELARSHLAEAAAVVTAGNPVDVTTYELQRGMLMLLDEDWRGAAQLMRAAVTSGRDSGWPLREHIALLGHALAATQVDSLAEAEQALQDALAHPFYAVCRWHHWIAALVEANLAERQRDRPRALTALRRAFATGRECGFDFGPMPYCCGDMMSRLAALALEHDIDTPFVSQMVRRHALPPPANAPPAWPWTIRIRTLGAFTIERDGAPAAVARKEARKPLELLWLLLALGGASVPVARLCAGLWPEASGDAARNSFDNTLHRLRKILGGERHVQLRAGSLSLDPATCWNDVDALEAVLAEPGPALAGKGVEAANAWVDRVLVLYRGAFLVGEDELPDVLAARDRIQSRVARLVATHGARLESAGWHAAAARLYQRVVEHQPLAEDLVRRQMTCLIHLGQPAEAYEAYRRCRQQLSVVLGIRPSAQTEALASGLRNL